MSGCVGPALALAVSFLGCSALSWAQATLHLPGCETSSEVRQILDAELAPQLLDRMKFVDRLSHERRVLEEVIAKYPRELEPYEKLRDRLNQYAPEEYEVLRRRWESMAKDHPDDPLALLLTSDALMGKDTVAAIGLLEKARRLAPNFAWPARQLAGVYFDGKYADAKKAEQYLGAFFGICPGSMDGFAQWMILKHPSLQPKAAAALRARLEKETAPARLKQYRALWGQEFRSRPPSEHAALRAQIARDVMLLETMNSKPDAEWQALLINGYKQSGATKEAVTSLEDRLIREFPHSNQAYDIVSDRWDEAHKEPAAQSDSTAWTRYQMEYLEALKRWIRDYPDDAYLQHFAWFDAIREDAFVSEQEGISALDAYLQNARDFKGPAWFWLYYPNAARFLVEHAWQPVRAIDLLETTRTIREAERARDRDDDNLSEEDLKNRRSFQFQQDQDLNGLLLRAALQARKPEAALKLRAAIEVTPPPEKDLQSAYWTNRARFELIQGRVQDALTYYQMALRCRTVAPKASRGTLRDDLTEEARALWSSQGGTETSWDVWSELASAGTAQLSQGSWATPKQAIPSFELSDLSGKTWRLKDLEGKVVLINIWATWCGPCQAELPNLQRFYDRVVKSRPDIQVLTFNIDASLGLVEPYLKEKGYTFPVLPAYSAGLLQDFGIPQTWVLDAHGASRWELSGYSSLSYDEFEKTILERIESIK